MDDPNVVAALIAGAVALAAGAMTYIVSVRKIRLEVVQAEQRLRREYKLEFAAETVTKQLLMDDDWRLRSFRVIKHHLNGFEDDDLRQLLIRAGAVSFQSKSGQELWGLLERNHYRLGITKIDEDPGEK